MNRHEVGVDKNGKVSLDFRVRKEHKFYVAEEADDGTITLLPAELVPAVRIHRVPPHGGLEGVVPSIIDEIKERVKEIPLWGKE